MTDEREQPEQRESDEHRAAAESEESAGDLKGSNVDKNPDDWVTGDEPMTGAQRSYLQTLSEQANEPFDEGLSKADASKRIDELQSKTGRGGSS